jgi:ATP-dependent DNA helicase MPH1
MYTKGKRWDRTEFAASGRRIGAEKAKKKGGAGKGRRRDDDDDSEEDEDDDEDPFGLEPRPLVDMSELEL